MSTLSNNLQQIYTIKNQIKEVIGTTSDIFSEYPQIIYNLLHPSTSYIECADYAALLACNVGDNVMMTNARTEDNDEAIGTVGDEFIADASQMFNIDLTPYTGANYVMFSDAAGQASGEVYGIFIDTNSAFTAAGYPGPASQNPDKLQFKMQGEIKWKNASAGTGDVSSLVIGQASNITVVNS